MTTWRVHVVCQGETLLGLAARYGFDAGAVWDDARNEPLRRERTSPNVLAPGDVVYLPSQEEDVRPAFPREINRYRARVPAHPVAVRLLQRGLPLRNEECVVELPTGPLHGRTDGDGLLRFAVPSTVQRVWVIVQRAGLRIDVLIGHLDPMGTPTGLGGRLQNLGLLTEDWRGASAERRDSLFAQGLRSLQRSRGLAETGELDEPTRAALAEAHGA